MIDAKELLAMQADVARLENEQREAWIEISLAEDRLVTARENYELARWRAEDASQLLREVENQIIDEPKVG